MKILMPLQLSPLKGEGEWELDLRDIFCITFPFKDVRVEELTVEE